MASQYDYDGQEDEDIAAERDLGDDAMWKVIQKNTFTRWANENLKPAKVAIVDLEKDLSDGLKLISLIEGLSGKKFAKYNKKPTFRTQKFENVTLSLKFLEQDEGIKLVNIDSSDLVDGKLKLIMGLIWSLILHYSISMPMWEGEDPASSKDQTPKQRLLAWIQNKIPEKNITNFTSDWNDGTAIAALVDALAPGMCPDWPKMNPKDAVKNARAGEDAAEKWLDIPQLIKPEEMCNPKVDELSMMTYLSRFPNAKLKGGAPVQDKTNPARVKAYGPGLEPTGNVVGAPARFMIETLGAGKGDIEVVVLNPKGQPEKCEVVFNNDRALSYNCVYHPTMEGQYKVTINFATKPIPKCPYLVQVTGKVGDPAKVTAQGPGIEPTGVKAKRKTYFEVTTKGAGAGVVDVGIVDPAGKKDTVKPIITKKSDDLWYVEYTALTPGLHSVNVNFAGKPIPKSPYPVGVSGEHGPAADPSKLGKPVACTPREAALASIATPLKAVAGSTAREPDDTGLTPIGVAPPGQAAVPGKPLPLDAKKCWATGRGIQPKGVRVGEDADFQVHTENAGEAEPKVLIVGPGGQVQKFTTKKVNSSYEYVYKPLKPGTYIVTINFAGQGIPKSPFKVEVAAVKQSKVKAYGPGLETGMVGQPALFTVEPNGEAPIGFKIEGPSQAKIDVKKDPATGTMDVSYWPTAPGEYAVHVLCNNDDTPKSPYMADIKPAATGFDASKVVASGPGLQKTGVVARQQTEFTVDARQAGVAPLGVSCVDVDGTTVEVKVTDNKNGTYTCHYTALRGVKHTVSITWGGVSIAKSPFKVFVTDAGGAPAAPAATPTGPAASRVKVYGPAVEGPIRHMAPTLFIVDCKEAGPGQPQVSLADSRNIPVPFRIADQKDRTYKVDFTPSTHGVHTCSVNFMGQAVPRSPFKIPVEAGIVAPGGPDASKVKVSGPAVEGPVEANKPTYLVIDCKEAGPGDPLFSLFNDRMAPVPYKLINNNDRTYRVEFQPPLPGALTANVLFVGKPVPKSPFKITVEAARGASKVKVYGPALEQPVVANETTHLVVDCKEAGDGQPAVTLVNDRGVPVPFTLTDNKDKTFAVHFQPTAPGLLTASVFFNGQAVPRSPFNISVHPGVTFDSNKVTVHGLPEVVPVNKETPFLIRTAGAGPGQVKVTDTTPSGQNNPVLVEQTQPDVSTARFTPTEPGPHSLAVTFNDQPVPHSPFRTIAEAPNPFRVRVYGPAVEGPVSPYQPTYFIVDCKEAGPGEPAISLADSSGTPLPLNVLDNRDHTYRVEFTPTSTGTIRAEVKLDNQPVPNSPFTITVQSGARVYGPAVEGPVPANQVTYLIVDCKDAEPGLPEVGLLTQNGIPVPAQLTDNGDRTYKVEFQAPLEETTGGLVAAVNHNGKPVAGSPFKINVSSGPLTGDANKVIVKDLPQVVPIGRPIPFTIDTSGAGPGQARVDVVSPAGQVTPAPIGQSPDGFVSQILATEAGPHDVHVTFNDKQVPGSPFKVNAVPEAGDASKVKAYGAGLYGGTTGTPCDFTIDTQAAGPGALGLTIDGPTKAEIECFDRGAGIYDVRYWPTEAGEYKTNILYDEKPITGSPFTALVTPAQQLDVSGIKTFGPGVEPGVFLESVTDFTVDAKSVGPKGQGKVKAILTTPSGTLTEAQIIDNKDGTFTGLYTAFEEGPHKLDVSYDGLKVPNSPFNVTVVPGCDPSKVKAYGPGLEGAVPHKPATFTISTRGAGQGGIGLSVIGPTEPKVGCVDNQDGTLTVEYLPDSVGDHEIGITFANQPIPGSPFHVNVSDVQVVNASLVKCYGPGLNPKGVRKGTPGLFTVDATQAGEAQLTVTATDVANGQQISNDVIMTKPGLYDVTYTPDFEGPCRVDVSYGGQPVPNSPFLTEIQPSTDPSKVFVSGDGVSPSQNVLASVPVSFIVDTRQAGHKQLDVDVKGPQGATVKPNIQSAGDGTYLVSYTPEDVGLHTIDVKYGGQEIPSGPFRVNVQPTGDANKVKVETAQIKQSLAVGEESVITLNTSLAGLGHVTCQLTSTTTTEDVEVLVVDNFDGTVTIRYTPTRAGIYNVDLKFGGRAVPLGRIVQTVGQITEQHTQQITTTDQHFGQASVSQQPTAVQPVVQVGGLTGEPVQPAPQEGVSSPYQPCDFAIKIGPDFSQTDAIITTPSGVKHRPRIVDNQNGTIKVCYQPAEFGLHTLDVTYGGAPAPKSPFNFYVHEKRQGKVIAYGPGLCTGTAGQSTFFTVVTKDAGPGGLGLAIEGPSKAEIQCKDNKDGTATITYTPVVPGDYKIVVKFAGQLIQGAPFVAKIAPSEFTQQSLQQSSSSTSSSQRSMTTTKTTTHTRQSHVTMGRTSDQSLTTTETDLSNLTAIIRSPSGSEEPCGLKRQPNGQLGISFTPREGGEHLVSVYREGQSITGSPFRINISGAEVANASKVKVTGHALTSGKANEVNEFNINTNEAGVGSLSLSVVGPGKFEMKCEERPDGSTGVTYKPTEPGQYQLSVKYADEHVPGSPFNVTVVGEGSGRVKERVVHQQQATHSTTSVGSLCELNIKMAGVNVRDVEGTVTSPSGLTDRCDVIDLGDNRFSLKFKPQEMGVHTVSLKNQGIHIPGSPFPFTVGPIMGGGGPHKVRAIGTGLERGDVNTPAPFTIITREAGPGSLALGIEGPSKAIIDLQDKRDGTSDVTYVVTEPGEYHVGVKYNGLHIPDSPFKVFVAPSSGDSRRLHVQNLQQHGLQTDTPAQFLVDFNGAQGRLDATIISPSGVATEAIVQEVQKDKYSVNFVPKESGVHQVHVRLNGNHVPGSPYPVQVGRLDAEPSLVKAYGDGLVRGSTGQQCKFIVNTVNAGCGALSVGISGPSKVELQCKEVEEGYEFSYTPLSPGDYLITIKYGGNTHVPGSPFKAHIEGAGVKPAAFNEESRVVMQTVTKTTTTKVTSNQQQVTGVLEGDASKVTVSGPGLHEATVNQETVFSVNGSTAGHNMLVMGIAGPSVPCEYMTILHLGGLQYTVKYKLSQPGNYALMVKWGDQHIPGSPFRITAHQ